MIPRVLEPEAMDTAEEASEYDAMDHAGVNDRFVADLLDACGGSVGGLVLDLGTGTARIPIALCRADPSASVVGNDLARHMLDLAERNVKSAGLEGRIRLELGDAKGLAAADGAYACVMSNTIIHHIPDPAPVFREVARVVRPGGLVFIRDLVRPDTAEQVDWFVDTYAAGESPSARALFAASLHASLTLEEVRDLVAPLGCAPTDVRMTSNRHWTWCWQRTN